MTFIATDFFTLIGLVTVFGLGIFMFLKLVLHGILRGFVDVELIALVIAEYKKKIRK